MQVPPPYMPANPMLPPPVSSRLLETQPAQQVVVNTKASDLSSGRKFKVATFLTVIYVILSNSHIHGLINKIFTMLSTRDPLITEGGALTWMGIAVHAAIFFVIALIMLMN